MTLSGQITGGNLIVNMADATDTLNLSNTDSTARNSYAETRISKGIVAVHDIGGGTANTLGNGA
ncbi:MAG: hypothetical protein LBQ54_15535, partial [Planctomycetaceae bacterium]|nr:hypothetical protein [Planctomycetaceae bacterium]